MPRQNSINLEKYHAEGYAYLETLEQVKRFLDTPIFERIEKTRDEALGDMIVVVQFDVKADDLMPHPRARLLEQGLVKTHNLARSSIEEDGSLSQTVTFFGSRLQLVLRFLVESVEE